MLLLIFEMSFDHQKQNSILHCIGAEAEISERDISKLGHVKSGWLHTWLVAYRFVAETKHCKLAFTGLQVDRVDSTNSDEY